MSFTIEITDEQEQALKDGETVELLLKDRDGAADVLEVELFTKGVIGGHDMGEAYPDLWEQDPLIEEYDTGAE